MKKSINIIGLITIFVLNLVISVNATMAEEKDIQFFFKGKEFTPSLFVTAEVNAILKKNSITKAILNYNWAEVRPEPRVVYHCLNLKMITNDKIFKGESFPVTTYSWLMQDVPPDMFTSAIKNSLEK